MHTKRTPRPALTFDPPANYRSVVIATRRR